MGNGQWAMGNGQWAMGNGQWQWANGRMGERANGRMGEWVFGEWWRQAINSRSQLVSEEPTAHCPLPTAPFARPPDRSFRKHNSRIFDSSHLFRFQRTRKALARVMRERN